MGGMVDLAGTLKNSSLVLRVAVKHGDAASFGKNGGQKVPTKLITGSHVNAGS